MAWYWQCQGGYSSTGNTCKESGSPECDCAGAHLGIQVLCIYMTHLETVSIQYCANRPVMEQLVQHCLFPCTPLRPTLAIDIFMLEWATTLFLHMAPNVCAWTMTTEIMLKQEGYAFDTSDSLHHHFNNALMHYQMLIQLVNAEMGQMVNAIPSPSQNQHCDDMIPPLPITLDESTPINGRKYQNAHQPPTFSFDLVLEWFSLVQFRGPFRQTTNRCRQCRRSQPCHQSKLSRY